MAKTYRITSGGFTREDGKIAHIGETIELDDDVAKTHADRLQLVPQAKPEAPAPAAEKK